MILTAKQQQANALLQTPAKHILLDGGSRSGKTALFVRAICTRAIKAPRSRHAILRFRFSHAKESIGMDTLPKVMRSCYPQIPCNINKSDWFLPFPNESEIWIGGIDDKERTEKILGKEFATILLNETSQIPYASRNVIITRLSQKCEYDHAGTRRMLALKMYYDQNPPSKSHWAYQLFYLHRDPETKQPLLDAADYAAMTINPRDNLEHLHPDYLKSLEALPARLKRRFLDGIYGDSTPNALFREEDIDRWRVTDGNLPDMVRIVVAVDPSGADDENNADNDEIGIIVAGLGTDGNGYLMEDLTVKAGPATWGRIATDAYDRHAADAVVGEINYGGAMVKHVIQTARPRTNYKQVTASRGKVVRAEPISALYEIGKVRHVGYMAELEDELGAFSTTGYLGDRSPNRADAAVWALSELFPGIVQDRSKPKPRPAVQIVNRSWMGG